MRSSDEVPITAEGLAGVRSELQELTEVRRPQIVAKIKSARELGDLSENFEYHAARNEQSFLETRIQELQRIVQNHVLIQLQVPTGEVQISSTVRFVEEDSPEESYKIVGPAEADPAAGRVSYESAIGRALLGRRAGDEVQVETPTGGSYTVRIVSIT
ncbi:MAG: transcription elongation factor GreA [Candidatus Dormibacteraeota bacterium]|nr:transcription elongation factor GreA [Candidatus Dormibacteraeota bacterium]